MSNKLRQSRSGSPSTVASVGKKLREIRIRRGLTQIDLEKMTGLLRSHVSRIENGWRIPSIETLERFAEALQIPVYAFFYSGRTDPAQSQRGEQMSKEAVLARGEDEFYAKLWEALRQLNEADRQALLKTAQKMARRASPTRGSSG